MILVYAPAVKQLIDTIVAYSAGNADLEELQAARDEAVDFSKKARERFLNRSLSRVREQKSEEIYNNLCENLERRTSQLSGLDEVLRSGDQDLLFTMVKSIEDVSFDIFGVGVAFAEIQESFPKESPIPVFDDFIKLIRASVEGHVEKEAVAERLKMIEQNSMVLKEESDRFALYHPSAGTANAEFSASCEQLTNGLSLAMEYSATGLSQKGEEAISLISSSTGRIARIQETIEKLRREEGLSTNGIVDDFLHGLHFFNKGGINLQQFKEEIIRLDRYMGALFLSVDEFKDDNPINASVEKDFAPKFAECRTKLSELIKKIGSVTSPSPQLENMGKETAENLTDLLKMQGQYLEKAGKRVDMSAIPSLSDLQQAIIGVYKDVVTFTTLEALLLQNMKQLQSMVTRLKKLPQGIRELDNLKSALAKMLEGLSVTSSFFLGHDRSRLSAGLEILEGSYMGITDAESLIAGYEQMGAAKECISCGYRNLPNAFGCAKCGKKLPATSEQNLDRFEMMASESGTTMIRSADFVMREVEILENLIRAMEKGEDIGDAVRAFIEVFTARISETLKRHQYLIEPVIRANPDDHQLKDNYENFASHMELFRKAASEISLFLIYRDVQYLRKGLQLLKQAQEMLMDLTEQLTRMNVG